ncbi:MAG: hypothetical protein ACRENE_10905 [Polyangiaceae bacterium]
MISRRDALGCIGALAAAACSAGRTPASPPPAPAPESRLALDPLVNLVPAAGLKWLVDLRPPELLSSAAVGSGVDLVVPGSHFDAFAQHHGGVDLRRASEVAVAGFADVTLSLVRATVDPARVEKAFSDRAGGVEGRAIEPGIVRFWGTVGPARQQMAVFGHKAVALEQGQFGPLRVATYFAQGKLRRSPQALRADPLAGAAERLGDAPARAFARGPFTGPWAKGLGGLLAAATAGAASARPVRTARGDEGLKLTVLVLGAWGDDSAQALARLGAAFNVLAQDPLGRLCGLDRPLEGPHVVGDATEVRLEVTVDPTLLARGIRDATGGTAADIVASLSAPPLAPTGAGATMDNSIGVGAPIDHSSGAGAPMDISDDSKRNSPK